MIIPVDHLGLRKFSREVLRAGDLQVGLHHLLHRVIRRYPGTHHGPAPGHIEADFDLQTFGLPHGVAEEFPPLGSQKLNPQQRCFSGIPSGADQVDSADSLGPELLQVARDAFPVDPVEEPPPVNPGFGTVRRGKERGLQGIPILTQDR